MNAGVERSRRQGAGTFSKIAATLAAVVVLALAAAVVIEAIALSDDDSAGAGKAAIDAGPAESTPIDNNTWLVSGEIGDEGLFICEKGFQSATQYGNDLIVICLD